MTETAAAPHGDDDTVVQMLCLRNDELLAEKEALAVQLERAEAERDEAYARGKQAFDDLRRAKADRAAAIQQAVARARRDWAAQGSPWVKARWQAEALEEADRRIPARYARARIVVREMAADCRRQAEGGES